MQRGSGKKENLFAKAFGSDDADKNNEDVLTSSNAAFHSCPFEYGYVEQPGDPGADNWTQVKKTKSTSKKPAAAAAPSHETEQLQSSSSSSQKTSAPDLKVYNQAAYDRIAEQLQNKVKLMIIMRGAMGSGKSTLAKQVKHDGVICSADDYFLNNNGVYVYDAAKVNDAHVFCKTQAREALKKAITPVIIDNTNSCVWEFKPYVKMAIEFGYQVEILEPKTPWSDKPALLADLNTHKVPLAKIKKYLKDYEKCDLSLLVEQCKADVLKRSATNLANSKSGSFLPNFSEYVNKKSDWALPEFDTPAPPAASGLLKSTSGLMIPGTSVRQDFLSSLNLNSAGDGDKEIKSSSGESILSQAATEKTATTVQSSNFLLDTSTVLSEKDLEKSTNEIKQLFPDIETEIIVDFLLKYENDVEMVTNLLLDSVNLSDHAKPSHSQIHSTTMSSSSSSSSPQQANSFTLTVKAQAAPARVAVDTLKNLCINALNSFDVVLRTRYDLMNANELLYNLTYVDLIGEEAEEKTADQQKSSSGNSSGSKAKNEQALLKVVEPKQQAAGVEQITASSSDSGYNEAEDPLLKFKLDKKLLGSLIELFGDSNDEKNMKNNKLDVEIGFNMAYSLYLSWKRTVSAGPSRESSPVSSKYANDDLDQIAKDELLSIQLFDEINNRDPLNNMPAYLSEKDTSLAKKSLRQIMAEQAAEEALEKSGVVRRPSANVINEKLALKKTDSSNDISSKLKLKQLYEKYEHVVDKKMIEQIFKNLKNNFDDTCKYIDQFYQISGEAVKEPVNKFKLTASKSSSPSLTVTNYARQNSAETRTTKSSPEAAAASLASNRYTNDQRVTARKYVNLRQAYFDKAHEAYTRGWKNVAYYYSMLGHQQSENINHANKEASMEILMANNPELGQSNTLDLHGLYIKEALDILKQVMYEKKQELMFGKSKKTILFVITGYGKHSESGPRLRPSVINYLNTNKITYQEPHAGLFRINLI